MTCTQLCSCLGCMNMVLEQENGDRESGFDSHWTLIMMTYTVVQISELNYFPFRDLFFITNRSI